MKRFIVGIIILSLMILIPTGIVWLFLRIKARFTRRKPLPVLLQKYVRQLGPDEWEVRYTTLHLTFLIYYLGLLGLCALILNAFLKVYILAPEHSPVHFIIIMVVIFFLFCLSLLVINKTEGRIFLNLAEETLYVKHIFTKSPKYSLKELSSILPINFSSFLVIGARTPKGKIVILLMTLAEEKTLEYLDIFTHLLNGKVAVETQQVGVVVYPAYLKSKFSGEPLPMDLKKFVIPHTKPPKKSEITSSPETPPELISSESSGVEVEQPAPQEPLPITPKPDK